MKKEKSKSKKRIIHQDSDAEQIGKFIVGNMMVAGMMTAVACAAPLAWLGGLFVAMGGR